MVARGYSQEYLKNDDETLAPVARITTLRFLFAFGNQFDLKKHYMDAKTGLLKGEIYMKVSDGVESKNWQVCVLNKTLYGLKQ